MEKEDNKLFSLFLDVFLLLNIRLKRLNIICESHVRSHMTDRY
jgi:hypothetical protein